VFLRHVLDDRTTELEARNSEYGERVDLQAATIGVLKAMSASSGLLPSGAGEQRTLTSGPVLPIAE
jgi:hypothetical protein